MESFYPEVSAMDLKRMEEFVLIAEYQSIKDAADELKISASTLSSRLSSFEKSLGTSLFFRNGSSLILTASGEHFYGSAKKIVSDYHHMCSALSALPAKHEYHNIRIGVVGSGLPFHLGPFLDLINRQHPDIQLDLVDENYCSIKEGLLSGKVDLFFAPVMNHISYDGIIRFPLSGIHQYITLPNFHPLAERNSISLKELNNETFILYPQCAENCIRDFQLENLKASGISFSLYETDSASCLCKLLIPIGKGVFLFPLKQTETLPNSVMLPLDDVPYSAPTSLFYRRDDQRAEVAYFIDEFKHFVKEHTQNDHRKAL
jgi:DNA-binding transcriptional LysR family regulator